MEISRAILALNSYFVEQFEPSCHLVKPLPSPNLPHLLQPLGQGRIIHNSNTYVKLTNLRDATRGDLSPSSENLSMTGSSPFIAPSTVPQPLEEFSLFLTLPPELQLKIWNHAIADIAPRTVNLRAKVRGNVVPGLLQACKNSRSEGAKTYQRHLIVPHQNGHSVFINYAKDVVSLDRSIQNLVNPFNVMEEAASTFPRAMENVQDLAMDIRALTNYGPYTDGFENWPLIALLCPAVKKVSIILTNGDDRTIQQSVDMEVKDAAPVVIEWITMIKTVRSLEKERKRGRIPTFDFQFLKNGMPKEVQRFAGMDLNTQDKVADTMRRVATYLRELAGHIEPRG